VSRLSAQGNRQKRWHQTTVFRLDAHIPGLVLFEQPGDAAALQEDAAQMRRYGPTTDVQNPSNHFGRMSFGYHPDDFMLPRAKGRVGRPGGRHADLRGSAAFDGRLLDSWIAGVGEDGCNI
jgi:hypothetical protein